MTKYPATQVSSTFPSFLKVWYMLWWRFSAVVFLVYIFCEDLNQILPLSVNTWFTIAGVALVVAFLMTYIGKKTLVFFPIVQFIFAKHHTLIFDLNIAKKRRRKFTPQELEYLAEIEAISARTKAKQEEEKRQRDIQSNIGSRRESIPKSTNPGLKTGYLPRDLDSIQIPMIGTMWGSPGAGLSDSGFDDTSISLGQKGEINFAKALQKAGILENVDSYWSLYTPKWRTLEKDSEADIDCVLAVNNRLYLVDLKYYPGGDVTYRSTPPDNLYIYAQDNATGAIIGKKKKTSKLMKHARDVFSQFARDNSVPIMVSAYVVIIPTNRGEATGSTADYPGDVPAITLSSFIRLMQRQCDGSMIPMSKAYSRASAGLGNRLRKLVKPN